MQRDFLPGVPEAVGMCSERLGRISTMLAGMVADKKLRAFQTLRVPMASRDCACLQSANCRAALPAA